MRATPQWATALSNFITACMCLDVSGEQAAALMKLADNLLLPVCDTWALVLQRTAAGKGARFDSEELN